MNKLRSLDEHGRAKAQERYGDRPVSEHGHSQVHRSVHEKFETDEKLHSPVVKKDE